MQEQREQQLPLIPDPRFPADFQSLLQSASPSVFSDTRLLTCRRRLRLTSRSRTHSSGPVVEVVAACAGAGGEAEARSAARILLRTHAVTGDLVQRVLGTDHFLLHHQQLEALAYRTFFPVNPEAKGGTKEERKEPRKKKKKETQEER